MWRVRVTSDELLQESGLAAHRHQGTHTHTSEALPDTETKLDLI